MSILSGNQSITPEWLLSNDWEKDGWGSISWRKEHNAAVWCKIYKYTDNNDWERSVEVIWFPKDFEGYVTGYGYGMQGMAFFNLSDSPKRNPVSKCEDVHDLTTFISATLTQLKKDPYQFICN